MFCHSEEPGELRLAHGCTVTMETLNRADVVDFFTKVCGRSILPVDQGGQFDIFVPLAACGKYGLEKITTMLIYFIICSLSLSIEKQDVIVSQEMASL